MSDDQSGEDDTLDEENHDRLSRVRGKRDSRRSRRSRQTDQAEQETQDRDPPQVEQSSMEAQGQQAAQEDSSEQATQAAQAKLEPVTHREHDTFYLSEDVRQELTQMYRRISIDVLEETGVDLDDQAVGGRNRYFRPLALLIGARELREMSPEELRETIEGEELIDDLPNDTE